MLVKLSKYNNWANSLLLDMLKITAETGSISIPSYCLSLLSHIANAEQIWMSRILGIVPSVNVWQLHDLDTCIEMLNRTGKELQEIVEKNLENDRVLAYKVSTGAMYETSVEDILIHVFNHGTYHRAQIAKSIKECGLQPVNTDYIQYLRIK